jgi:hypothetical protein
LGDGFGEEGAAVLHAVSPQEERVATSVLI